MKTREGFEPVEPADLFEGFGVEFDGGMGGVDARAAAGIFLRLAHVRRAVGAEEEAWIAAGGRL